MTNSSARRMRPVRIAAADALVRCGTDGTVYMRSAHELGAYPAKITEPLEYWADRTPDRPFLAQRHGEGWRRLSYADTLSRVRRVAQALLNRGLSCEKPVIILSANSIEQAVLALAAMYSGAFYTPVAPAYSLQAREYGTLGQIFDGLGPGL